jgi:hypothetical protein
MFEQLKLFSALLCLVCTVRYNPEGYAAVAPPSKTIKKPGPSLFEVPTVPISDKMKLKKRPVMLTF